MRSYKIDGIVIKRRNFLEKDRILTLFTNDRGKVEVLAKGARRPGSKLSYISDLGVAAKFSVSRTKSIDILTDVEPISLPDKLRGNFDSSQKLGLVFKYTNELFELDDPHPRTYRLLKDLLSSLSKKDKPILFLSFILNLIADLGLEPELFNCSTCSKKFTKDCDIVFSPQEGLTHARCCQTEVSKCNKNDVKLMRIILNYPFDKVADAKIAENHLRRVYKLVRSYFAWHFGKDLPERLI